MKVAGFEAVREDGVGRQPSGVAVRMPLLPVLQLPAASRMRALTV